MFWKALLVLGVAFLWACLSFLSNTTVGLPSGFPYGGGHLLPPPETVQAALGPHYHEFGYEEAWVSEVDVRNGLVKVETVDSNIVITARPSMGAMRRFDKGWLSAVTVVCDQGFGKECPLTGDSYRMFISNTPVQIVAL